MISATAAATIVDHDDDPAHPGTGTGPARPRSRRSRRSLSAWCADRRWRTLFAALAVLVGAVLMLGSGMRSSDNSDQLVGDSRAAGKALSGKDFGERPTENVVISARTGQLSASTVDALSR